MSERVKSFIAGVITTLLALALLWLIVHWWRSAVPTEDVHPRAPELPSVTPSPTATVISRVATPPAGYRLAGIAENAGQLFAVVEAPSGEHGLYRSGDEVPGLGQLLAVGDERATFETPNGPVTLWIAPAPTATRTITPRPATVTPARSPRPSPPASRR